MARALRRIALVSLLAACGSRTGLLDEPASTASAPDAKDAGLDGSRTTTPRDAGSRDAALHDDALPPIDANVRDADRTDCPDAAATLIYLVSTDNGLYSFYPPDASFHFIGNIACPAAPGETPFSMAVDRAGAAYVLYTNSKLYRVSTLTAACTATPYVPGQSNFSLFGMGFATNAVGPTEALYVAGDGDNGAATGLARIDPATWVLTPVGDFVPSIARGELTGTGDGRLFSFYGKSGGTPPSYVGEIGTTNAVIVGESPLANVDQGLGWAFAFWGGDFYLFTAPGGTSRVTRFRPTDNSVSNVTVLSTRIVGAGVSTCAPQQ